MILPKKINVSVVHSGFSNSCDFFLGRKFIDLSVVSFCDHFHVAAVAIPMENEKDIEEANALLGDDEINSPERYPTSQWRQFWTVLKRTLLFSRRDWVRNDFSIALQMHI